MTTPADQTKEALAEVQRLADETLALDDDAAVYVRTIRPLARAVKSLEASGSLMVEEIERLRAAFKELFGHADMVRMYVPPETTARRNIDGAVDRARASLSHSQGEPT